MHRGLPGGGVPSLLVMAVKSERRCGGRPARAAIAGGQDQDHEAGSATNARIGSLRLSARLLPRRRQRQA